MKVIFYQPENNIFGSCKPQTLLIYMISLFLYFLSPFRASEKKCGHITHVSQNTNFFSYYFIHRNSLWETPCETCGALRHRVIIKHRSHRILTQLLLLLTAAVTQPFQRNTQLPFTVMIYYPTSTLDHWFFPADFLKGHTTFQRIIGLTFIQNRHINKMFKDLCALVIHHRPSLVSASVNHDHTYWLDEDQPSNWLPNILSNIWFLLMLPTRTQWAANKMADPMKCCDFADRKPDHALSKQQIIYKWSIIQLKHFL